MSTTSSASSLLEFRGHYILFWFWLLQMLEPSSKIAFQRIYLPINVSSLSMEQCVLKFYSNFTTGGSVKRDLRLGNKLENKLLILQFFERCVLISSLNLSSESSRSGSFHLSLHLMVNFSTSSLLEFHCRKTHWLKWNQRSTAFQVESEAIDLI